MTITFNQIALSKLVTSDDNVRRTNRTERVEELAASIAAHGLLQNLTVKPVNGGKYAVIAGGRRLAAMKLLAKQKRLAKDAPVPCVVVAEGGNATEISLAENAMQATMHPADQYEAFAALNLQGLTSDDIAARFGVTPTVVVQRLKLGAVSPKLIGLYRQGDMNLEQLSAFAITDDHALQERVWEGLAYNRTRRVILEALSEGQVWMNDRRALFVGAEAYQAAGGTIVRDLFDEDGGGYFTDVALLTRLAGEKLDSVAETVKAEGWKWVEAQPQFDHGLAAQLRRIYPDPKTLSDEEQARIEDLSNRYDALAAELDEGGDFPEERNEAAEAELARLDREIDALRGDDAFMSDDIAIAGAIVSIGSEGEARVERGFVRREDDPRRQPEQSDTKTQSEAASGRKPQGDRLPDSLVAELTAFRTAALSNELAQRPGLALLATLHTLTADFFFLRGNGLSCLHLSAQRTWLASYGSTVSESRAMQEIEARHAAWEQRLPDEPDQLWDFLRDLEQSEQLELLAHCVSLTVDAVRTAKQPGGASALAHADRLARAVELDMTGYWQPTSANYFGRVAKPLVLRAVREATSPEDAQTCEAMKKPDMAARAEKLVAGKGWLPQLLRLAAA